MIDLSHGEPVAGLEDLLRPRVPSVARHVGNTDLLWCAVGADLEQPNRTLRQGKHMSGLRECDRPHEENTARLFAWRVEKLSSSASAPAASSLDRTSSRRFDNTT
jgi:hypothetical protein